LRDDIYNDVQKHVEELSGKNIPFWGQLSDKYQYENKEAIRSDYRREAKKRGYSLLKARQRQGSPKILIFDLENTPMEGYFWGLWQQNISIDAIVKDWHLLSYAAKWIFDDDVISEVLTPKEVEKEDDSRLAKSLWKLLDEADIAVAYNGLSFDFKRANTRFLKNGLTPPSYYVPVDPIVVARKKFDLASNKMDFLSEFIDGERKIHTNFSLWVRCMNGDIEALEEMEMYNRQDTIVLETLYLNLLPWMEGNHPNLNVFYDDDVSRCPMCSSINIEYNGKTYPTLTNLYETFVCEDCGYRGRSRKGLLDKQKRASVVR
jgi:hypothetical protein